MGQIKIYTELNKPADYVIPYAKFTIRVFISQLRGLIILHSHFPISLSKVNAMLGYEIHGQCEVHRLRPELTVLSMTLMCEHI